MIKAWVISHPGTGEPVVCSTFEECMEKWFEGFNLPKACTVTIADTFEEANQRVQEYFAKRSAAKKG